MPMARGYAEYSTAPLRPGRVRGRRPWLRTAQLDAVGWAALLGTCCATAGAGFAGLRMAGRPGRAGLVLALGPLGALVLVDRRRWAGTTRGLGWGGSPDEVAEVAEQLRSEGVFASVRPDDPDGAPWEMPGWAGVPGAAGAAPDVAVPGWAGVPGGPGPLRTASLVFRNRDTKAVQAVLRRRGVDLHPAWW